MSLSLSLTMSLSLYTNFTMREYDAHTKHVLPFVCA